MLKNYIKEVCDCLPQGVKLKGVWINDKFADKVDIKDISNIQVLDEIDSVTGIYGIYEGIPIMINDGIENMTFLLEKVIKE